MIKDKRKPTIIIRSITTLAGLQLHISTAIKLAQYKMTNRTNDLSWDYTTDLENTPLMQTFQPSTKQRNARNNNKDVSQDEFDNIYQYWQNSSKHQQHCECQDASIDREYDQHTNPNETIQSGYRNIRRMRRWADTFADWILVWTVLIQSIALLVNIFVDQQTNPTGQLGMVQLSSIITSSVNFILWMAVFAKYTHDIYHGQFSFRQILTSYLSGIFVFGGLYTATYALNNASWKAADDSEGTESFVETYGEFLFYSVNVATSRSTLILRPVRWYTKLIVAAQMLFSLAQVCILLVAGFVGLAKVSQETDDETTFRPEKSTNNEDSTLYQDYGYNPQDVSTVPFWQSASFYGSFSRDNKTLSGSHKVQTQ